MKITKLGLVALLAAGTLYAGTYNVDPVHSSVGFKVKHMMISHVKGSFDKFTGSFNYDEKTKQLISLSGNIKTASINTGNEKRDADLRSSNFFNAAKYPNINFVLTKIKNDKAYGKLTMHGITKEVKLDFENNGVAKDPWGNLRAGLTLSGKINRKDYNLMYNKILETGGVLIGDTVKLDVEIEGVLAK